MADGTPAPPAHRHILVVDDDRGYLDFMRLLLTAEGFTVATADSLRAADHLLHDARPDLVVCDVRMPGAAPFAALDRLAASPSTATLPVIVCTGAVAEITEAAHRLSARHIQVLIKPFDIDELIACVHRALAM